MRSIDGKNIKFESKKIWKRVLLAHRCPEQSSNIGIDRALFLWRSVVECGGVWWSVVECGGGVDVTHL